MDDPGLLERMRADWNRRAEEDANYFVAFGRRGQDDDEFFATGADVLRNLEREMQRTPARDAALEIGCGPGRLLRPLSSRFAEVHGVDVSGEMVRLARERLRGTPNAHVHVNSGSDLSRFPDNTFDFVYSYAVFQHIPSREVVFAYLRETKRVLKPGGIARFQVNGLGPVTGACDTWSGVRITSDEIAAFATEQSLALLALEQPGTQYMWVTYRKPGAGVPASGRTPSLRNICNAHTGESATPAAGPLAAISLWIKYLPEKCDLQGLSIRAGGGACRPVYIGPPGRDEVSQVNAALPEGVRTGLVPVEAAWNGTLLCAGWARILPAPPAAPRIEAISDGINLLSGTHIGSRSVKVVISDVTDASRFRPNVDGVEIREWETMRTDPVARRHEFNFRLPAEVASGRRTLRVALGRREFAPVEIEVA